METPSSTRRITRSVSKNMNNNIPVSKKNEESCEKGHSKSRQRNGKQQDRTALIDMTNDSPIVGLASGCLKTPSSSIAKQRGNRAKNTPGSGEALLRGQVKTLLQKVEEEVVISKFSLDKTHYPYSHLTSLVKSPILLVAPTPANTPQIYNLTGDDISMRKEGFASEHLISQVVSDILNGNSIEDLESPKITRSLLLDFSEKTESSETSECSSVVTYQRGEVENECKEKQSCEDETDDASVWSIQANASSIQDEDDEEGEQEEDFYEGTEIEEEENEDDGSWMDELCEGMSKISVKEDRKIPKFEGKHTRFVYNSDDEVVVEEEDAKSVSPSVMRLKGLPTPKGKHFRFHEEEVEGS